MEKKLLLQKKLTKVLLFKNFHKKTIEDEDKTIIDILYNRNIITLSFDTGDGSKIDDIKGKFESAVSVPENPVLEDYTFTGWDPELPAKFPSKNTTYTAKWEKKNPTTANYTINHKIQNVENDDYTLKETETLSGTIGEKTAVIAKTYEGFTAQEISQKTIEAEDKTVIDILYDRNIITISFETGDGSKIDDIKGKFESAVTAPENPVLENYIFNGWEPELPVTFSKNATYTAKWEPVAKVDNITFTIQDIPSNANSVSIFRKVYDEDNWTYASVIFGVAGTNYTYTDTYADKEKIYSYKYLIVDGVNKLEDCVDVEIENSIYISPKKVQEKSVLKTDFQTLHTMIKQQNLLSKEILN